MTSTYYKTKIFSKILINIKKKLTNQKKKIGNYNLCKNIELNSG